MKKRFINEPFGFYAMLFLIIVFLFFLFLVVGNAHYSSAPSLVVIIFLILFVPVILICLVWWIAKTELISVENEKIECYRMFRKKVTINLTEIKEITVQEKMTYGISNDYDPCWKIEDHSEISIYIVQSNARKKIIEYIREQAQIFVI